MTEEEISTVPVFKIEVDGTELSPDILTTVESVKFEEEINTASMLVIKLSSRDFDKLTWRFIDLVDFHLGSEVKLYMGTDSNELMMVGEIVSIEPLFSKGFSSVEIRGYDRLHRLRFGKKRRTFSDMTDSDIASTIAGDWDLSPEVEDTGTTHPYMYQNNQSDLEFLLERAKRIRYEVFVEDKTLNFRPGKEDDSESMTLEYMVDLDEFLVKLSARYEGSEVVAQGWDFMKKEPITFTAKSGDEISRMSAEETGAAMTETAFGASSNFVVDQFLMDASDAEKVAIAKYNAHLVESVTGTGKCEKGNPLLRKGKTIEIKGTDRFSGIYYVTSTSHTSDAGGYKTSFKVRRVGV